MVNVIAAPEKIDFDEVEKYVCRHPHRNFFQSTKAFKFFSAVGNYEPILLVAKRGPEIVGTLEAVVVADWKGTKGYFTKRAICWGGPLVSDNDPEVCSALLLRFDEVISRKAIYSQFRNLFDTTESMEQFRASGWQYEDHLDIIVDLTLTEEELWTAVHSKRRNEIRRAEKEGTQFTVLESEDGLSDAYNILREVYNKARLPLARYEFFRSAYNQLSPENLKVFLAVHNGKLIGTMFTLLYGDTIYDWFAGGYPEHYDKHPNDLIPWMVFLWGKRNGYRIFDFGGAGKPNVPYGVRDYKKKFGGAFASYGRFEKIHKPLLYRTAKAGFQIYQNIKR